MSSEQVEDRRFGFGDNWLDFARDLSAGQIAEAEKSVRDLLQCNTLAGQSFLDVGSGSGLFSLVARRLGARVHSFDFDADSVLCTQRLRERHFPGDPNWLVEQGSVLDRDYVSRLGRFDVVYSWGVLHHTGAMHEAIESASSLVAPGGLFAFALYRRTRMCGFWRHEKRWYAGSSPGAQKRARAIYIVLMRMAFTATRRDFQAYVANYQSSRGMDYSHDVHDWMGGYPYESISPPEVASLIQGLGLSHVRSKTQAQSIGIFGSGCNEYLYRRASIPD